MKPRPRKHATPCQVDGCDQLTWARGYCGSHYQQAKKEGVIQNVRIKGDVLARFHASYKVNPETGCWEWTAWIHPKGYGMLTIGGKSKKVRAHRYSYEQFVGPIPDGMKVLHRCDVRRCCNWEHVFLGTDGDNMADCAAKGRTAGQLGTNGPKITPAMALNIRIMYAKGLILPEKNNPFSMQKIADIYGVDPVTISVIVKGKGHLDDY